jgi:hypothetical protein
MITSAGRANARRIVLDRVVAGALLAAYVSVR